MAYRDVDALFARVAHLESERARVRARAIRIVRRRRAVRVSRAWRCAVAVVVIAAALAGLRMFANAGCYCAGGSWKQQASLEARTLQAAAEQWRTMHGPTGCPTLERLVRDREISASSKLEDPWGHRYELACDGDFDVSAASAGPDGRFGTSDDIRF